MKTTKVVETKKYENGFEQTKEFIDSLLARDTAVRYRETTRQRVIPSMLTFPHKESPHI